MNQVLLFDTAIATSNLGDEIILEGVKNGLSRILDDAMVFRMGTHIANYSVLQMMHPSGKIRRLCDNADFKFICGTNLLERSVKRLNPQWMVNPFNARLYQDAVLVGVGRTGNYDSVERYTARLYQKFLSKTVKHSVRDEATKRIVESLGLQAINTGCPTLWGFDEEVCAGIPRKKAKNVIFSLSGYADQRDPEADRIMISCLKKNYEKLYAWVQTTSDQEYIEEICGDENVSYLYSLKRFSECLNPGSVDYIGTRLHGGIFALQHQCRTIIVSIDERAKGFHETNHIPIIERTNIRELEDKINCDFDTDIRVNHEAINEFVEQFL